mmetsp:Transcript_138749/g.241265  ORF Transcript_138749/g.241265 Transcript_138749/m.241265 type:complete len:93 (+) Transcript_138749:4125-4403(+)
MSQHMPIVDGMQLYTTSPPCCSGTSRTAQMTVVVDTLGSGHRYCSSQTCNRRRAQCSHDYTIVCLARTLLAHHNALVVEDALCLNLYGTAVS